jgi:acyl carrier protein
MKENEIFKEIVAIVGEFVKDPAILATVKPEMNIIKDLKVNSARLVDIIIRAEDAFGIAIDDEDADSIKTIGDAVRVVTEKLEGAEVRA